MNDNLVTCLMNRYVPEGDPAMWYDMKGALEEEHPCDAHFQAVYDPDCGEVRLGKKSLTDKCQINFLVIDLDTPDHVDLTEEIAEDYINKLENGPTILNDYYAMYTTRGGFRFIYKPTSPLIPSQLLNGLRLLWNAFRSVGLEVDELKDVPRLMRFPKVLRDGEETWNNPLFYMEIPEKTIDVGSNLNVKVLNREPIMKRSFGKLDPILKGEEPLCDPQDNWDTETMSFIGQMVKILHKEGYDIDDAICLLEPVADKLNEEDEETNHRDWVSDFEDKIERIWDNHHKTVGGVQGFMEKDIPVIDKPLPPSNQWLLFYNDFFYFYQPSKGGYNSSARKHLRISLNDCELVQQNRLMTEYFNTRLGKHVPIPDKELKDTYGTEISEVVYTNSVDIGTLVQENESWKVLFPLYKHADLEPEYNGKVDKWLKLIGEDEIRQYLAWVLDFSKGTSSMYLRGASGTGKNLLLAGLADCMDSGEVVPGGQLFGENNPSVMKSPIVHVDEDFASSRSVGSIFKRCTSETSIEIKAKYKPSITIKTCLRMIITVNHMRPFHQLYQGEISQDGEEAVNNRIFYVYMKPEAKEFLEENPDHANWVGRGSKFTLAKHLLWLYEQRETTWPRESVRWSVVGNVHDNEELIREGLLASETARSFLDFLFQEIDSLEHDVYTKGYLKIGANNVWLNQKMFIAEILRRSVVRVSFSEVSKVLRMLSVDNQPMVFGGGKALALGIPIKMLQELDEDGVSHVLSNQENLNKVSKPLSVELYEGYGRN